MRKSLLIIFILSLNAHTQNNWTVKGGMNFSAFRDADNDLITGYSFGIEKNINIYKSFKLCPEFLVSSQGGMIRNEPVWTDNTDNYLDAYDIEAKIQLFDLSLLVKYGFNYNSNSIITINLGTSYRIGLHDESRLLNKRTIYDSENVLEEYEDYYFKYRLT